MLTSKNIMLTILENKGSCDSLSGKKLTCETCSYYFDINYCVLLDFDDDESYKYVLNDYMFYYGEDEELFEAIL